VATIRNVRPDLLTEEAATLVERMSRAIPSEPPPQFFEKDTPRIEGVGEPTTACFFTLSNVNPTGWWMLEKYDGIRGFWNPNTKTFYSRRGTKLFIPQDITDAMPDDIFLDGEIW